MPFSDQKKYYVSKTQTETISNAFISKYLSHLKEIDIVQERRDGKIKVFSLTKMGKYYPLFKGADKRE